MKRSEICVLKSKKYFVRNLFSKSHFPKPNLFFKHSIQFFFRFVYICDGVCMIWEKRFHHLFRITNKNGKHCGEIRISIYLFFQGITQFILLMQFWLFVVEFIRRICDCEWYPFESNNIESLMMSVACIHYHCTRVTVVLEFRNLTIELS